jgi:hypothetical protein
MIENNSEIILNGPLNYIKLYCESTNQELYLFMDNHMNITKQKKCADYDAKDIDKYLYKILSDQSNQTNQTDPLDFFLEINPTDIIKDNMPHSNDNYISETRKMFRKFYKEQQINKSHNIRLHYIDVRDYSYFNELIIIMINLINDVEQSKLSNIQFIINELKHIGSKLVFINSSVEYIKKNKNINIDKFDMVKFKIISKNDNDNNNNDNDGNNNLNQKIGFQQLLLKILTKYSNPDNKKNIIDFFDSKYTYESNEAIRIIKELLLNLEEIHKIIEYQSNNGVLNIEKIVINEKKNIVHNITYYGVSEHKYTKYTRIVYDELIKLYILLLKLGTVFMDSFFLRRLIEKKYIKKSIIYTGGYHTVVYIWFLMKFYNFIITDYHFINTEKIEIKNNEIEEIEEINVKIKNMIDNLTNPNDLFEIFMPKNFNQCVKIKHIN